MLTALNNQVGLSADQQNKAKPIIDKHVADLEAVKNDATLDKAAKKAKVIPLRQQYVTDINGILTPDQQKKWAAARETNKAKVKARREAKSCRESRPVKQRKCHPNGLDKLTPPSFRNLGGFFLLGRLPFMPDSALNRHSEELGRGAPTPALARLAGDSAS